MNSLTEEFALTLLQSQEGFPIDFDEAVTWIGYSRRDSAKRLLIANFEQNYDLHISVEVVKRSQGGGSKREKIYLTVDCFKQFAMMAGTEQGREVRKYFIECERKLKNLLAQPKLSRLNPYWCDRLIIYYQQNKVPAGWWSIFEQTIKLVADLERYGYVLPEDQILDISIGKCWANHLRNELHVNPKDIARTYEHQYPGWTHPIDAFIYPVSLMEEFHSWLEGDYKSVKLPAYFKKKDSNALVAVNRLLNLRQGC